MTDSVYTLPPELIDRNKLVMAGLKEVEAKVKDLLSIAGLEMAMEIRGSMWFMADLAGERILTVAGGDGDY